MSGNDRAGLERLCHYILRPPFAQERLRLESDGRIAPGGRLRLIATLHDPTVIRKLLAHVGMARSGPSPGPAPPVP